MLPAVSMTQRQRARFDALRRKIFAEMAASTVKWRLIWTIPFHAFVLILLLVRGMPPMRAAIQTATTVVMLGILAITAIKQRRGESAHWGPGFSLLASIATLLAIVNTGGCASPLVMLIVPSITGVAFTMHRREARRVALVGFCLCFVGFALLSRTGFGALPPPLRPVGGFASAEYVILSVASSIYATGVLVTMGEKITHTYERVVVELAARREELCTEGEDRTQALEGIAARLAHEVKNPLAAIKGLSTHMARSATDAKVAERLSIVAGEADRLQAIVDGFLTFSRGLDDLKVAPVKPFEIARELTLLLETRANEVGVTLEVTGDANLSVGADGRKLRQALLNLVLNAMQASSEGARVRVDIGRLCGDGARLRVIDQGAGMSAEVLDRIRKPYFTTREGGSGLGVAVARGIVEQHGGTLFISSATGKGTTVTLEIPPTCALLSSSNALPNPLRAGALGDAHLANVGPVIGGPNPGPKVS